MVINPLRKAVRGTAKTREDAAAVPISIGRYIGAADLDLAERSRHPDRLFHRLRLDEEPLRRAL
ncbi:hypothetical protein [Mesorhizobium sp. ORS 3428]|uniref:hypothetical protein n=1 Tax=Mesorhizobium sp. ORS 3428 TaxID=540997 RepID=UPI0008DA9872|nr:hypothetical protein [Mesorhizobium sp. ORS 3428]OHV83225.1 hypothetical protein ORS3428_10180 [Mesorhizobium sp. ORS 3428]